MIVLDPYLFRGIYMFDPDLGFRVRPGERESNSLGFFDRDYAPRPAPGAVRIVVVGDSFSWNGGLDGNYTARLERMFEARLGGHRVDVVNTGYPGTNTREQTAMLGKFGFRYHPDIVVLGFFLGNDLLDAQPHRMRIVLNDTFYDVDERSLRVLFGYPLVPHWRLRQFARQKYQEWSIILQRDPAAERQPEMPFPEQTFLAIQRNRLRVFAPTFLEDERVAAVREALAGMRDLNASRGVEFHVALYPDEMQVDESVLSRVLDSRSLRRRHYDLDQPNRVVLAQLADLGIPAIDLTPAFRAAASEREEPLYIPRNTHWNAAGNELAATQLFDYLLPLVAARLAANGATSR